MFRTQRKRLISARIGLLGGAALALACSPAFGQATTATANVGVSATVVPSCSISTSNLSFGNYTASSGTANTTTATLSFTCTSTTTWWIGLDAGTNSGSTSNPRIMSDGSGDSLNYDLYQDSGHSTVWGNTSGTGVTSSSTGQSAGTGSVQTATIYGLIPIHQYVVPNAYTDTVVATINF
jgi:spore coat protein U-like protein